MRICKKINILQGRILYAPAENSAHCGRILNPPLQVVFNKMFGQAVGMFRRLSSIL